MKNLKTFNARLLTVPTAILLATLATYASVVELQWIWDDDQYVYENSNLTSWEGLYRIWFEPSASPQYYPVVFTVLWAEVQMFGLDPFGFHVVNLILHAVNAVLCYWILLQLRVPAAAWIAFAFGLHPVHVESVAWVTEIKNLLSGLFYGLGWLTLWPWLYSSEPVRLAGQGTLRGWFGRYALGCLLFIGALLSKSVTATLPAGMLIGIWYTTGKIERRQWLAMMPLLALGAALGWNTARLEREHVGAMGGDWSYGLVDRFGIAARCIVHYIANLAWPWQQTFFYPRFETSWTATTNWASIVLVAALFALCCYFAWRGNRGPCAGFLFFAGSAFPALGFLNVYPHRFSFVADHFIYIASIGALCVIVSVLHRITSQLTARHHLAPAVTAMPMLLVAGCCALQVNHYLPTYANQVTLWEDTLSKNPHCPAAMQNLGLQYSQLERLPEAEAILKRALDYDFDRFQTWNSLGVVYRQLGNHSKSECCLRQSLELKPDNPQANINLANLVRLKANKRPDQLELARQHYRWAWQQRAEYLSAFGIASTSYELGELKLAAEWFEQAYRQKLGDIDAMFNHAQILFELGDHSQALSVCQRILHLHPGDQSTLSLLANLQK